MIKKLFLVIPFLLVLGSPLDAKASLKAEEFSNMCKEYLRLQDQDKVVKDLKDGGRPPKYLSAGYCAGLINGLSVYNSMLEYDRDSGGSSSAPLWCFLEWEFSTDQLAKVVIDHVARDPRFLNIDARVVAIGAFKEAFPCPK